MSGTTTFTKLNEQWNAEPNAPDPHVLVEGRDVILDFYLNPFQLPAFAEGQRGQLLFTEVRRWRLGATNDEGWYRGQCRFSGIAPAWGEFYEVTGDLLLSKCPQAAAEDPMKTDVAQDQCLDASHLFATGGERVPSGSILARSPPGSPGAHVWGRAPEAGVGKVIVLE